MTDPTPSRKRPRRKSPPRKASEPTGRMQVVLERAHTHRGHDFAAGDTLTVSAPIGRWLIHHGIGRLATQ